MYMIINIIQKKNEINFAYADAKLDTLKNLDKTKFYGTEYVIQEFTQICPFISAKLIRNEYCVIWRDNNFRRNLNGIINLMKYLKIF